MRGFAGPSAGCGSVGISRPEYQVARAGAGPYRGPGTAILPSRYHSPAIIGRWPAHPEAGARMAAGTPTNEPPRGHPWHAASTRPSWSAIPATTRKPNTRKVAWPTPRSAGGAPQPDDRPVGTKRG